MKTNEAVQLVAKVLSEKPDISPQEITYQAGGLIHISQVHSSLKMLLEQKHVGFRIGEKNIKFYTLTESGADQYGTAQAETPEDPKAEELEHNETKEEPTSVNVVKSPGGRDLTKYTFNGVADLNKGRLALAVITHYAKEKKPKLKDLQALFPDTMVPPYGVIKPKKEAIEISKSRARFFIKEEETVKIADSVICVSNQWTPDRINEFINIARKKLGYKIK